MVKDLEQMLQPKDYWLEYQEEDISFKKKIEENLHQRIIEERIKKTN
jgi:hypothetical protein